MKKKYDEDLAKRLQANKDSYFLILPSDDSGEINIEEYYSKSDAETELVEAIAYYGHEAIQVIKGKRLSFNLPQEVEIIE